MCLWGRVFARLQSVEEARGAPPEKALILFIEHAPADVQEVLDEFKKIHATSLINAEALRKLIKKFDKHHKGQRQAGADLPRDENRQEHEQQQLASSSESFSCKLLPEVCASNFMVGLHAIHEGAELMREELGWGQHAVDPSDIPQPLQNASTTGIPINGTADEKKQDDSFIHLGRHDSEDPVRMNDSFGSTDANKHNDKPVSSFIPQLAPEPGSDAPLAN